MSASYYRKSTLYKADHLVHLHTTPRQQKTNSSYVLLIPNEFTIMRKLNRRILLAYKHLKKTLHNARMGCCYRRVLFYAVNCHLIFQIIATCSCTFTKIFSWKFVIITIHSLLKWETLI